MTIHNVDGSSYRSWTSHQYRFSSWTGCRHGGNFARVRRDGFVVVQYVKSSSNRRLQDLISTAFALNNVCFSQHLTKTLASTLASKRICVNAICPGVYASRMTAFGLKTNKEGISAAYPMGRIGTPEDIGGLVLFLTSRAGAHISGTFIETDGGALNAGRGYRSKADPEVLKREAKL